MATLIRCAVRKFSTDGAVIQNGQSRKIQIFRATCVPHRQFKQFASRAQRDKWDCPGHPPTD